MSALKMVGVIFAYTADGSVVGAQIAPVTICYTLYKEIKNLASLIPLR